MLYLALYLGEIVRLIIVDLVGRSILFPGRMQKSPNIRPDYNIFLTLRGKTNKQTKRILKQNSSMRFFCLGSFYAKHVADIESDKSKKEMTLMTYKNSTCYLL